MRRYSRPRTFSPGWASPRLPRTRLAAGLTCVVFVAALVVYLLIRDENLNLSEADRLSRIYMAYVTNPRGVPGPFGLTQYTFREDSGYRREDLFVGQTDAGP